MSDHHHDVDDVTVRERLEAIQDKLYYALLLSTQHDATVEAMRNAREDARAALATLDHAPKRGDMRGGGYRLLADRDTPS